MMKVTDELAVSKPAQTLGRMERLMALCPK